MTNKDSNFKHNSEDQQPVPTIMTTPEQLKEAVGEAVQAVTTELADQVQAAINDMTERVEKIKQQVTQTITVAEIDETLSDKIKEQQRELAEQIPIVSIPTAFNAVNIDKSVPPKEADEPVASIPEGIKEAIAEEVRTQMTATQAEEIQIASQPIPVPIETTVTPLTETTLTSVIPASTAIEHHPDNPVNKLIKLVGTQTLLGYMIMATIILGLGTYIAFDKIKANDQTEQMTEKIIKKMPISEPVTPAMTSANMTTIVESLNQKKEEESPAINSASDKIVQNQIDTLKQKSTSDVNIEKAVVEAMNESIEFTQVFQSNLDALKLEGKPDIEAVPQAFLNDNLIAPIMKELSDEIKAFPITEKTIKERLKKLARHAERWIANNSNN